MNISEAIQVFLDARVGLVSAKTMKNNKLCLGSIEKYFGSREIETIALADLRAWRKEMVERESKYGGKGRRQTQTARLSPHTVHGHIRTAKQFFAWLTREGMLQQNPAFHLEQVPISHAITASKMMSDEDFEKMLAASGGDAPERIRDRALLWFLRQTGARLGGVTYLTMDSLELDRARASVTEKGKAGGKTRTVYLKSEALQALREWLDMRANLPLTTDRVFTTVPDDAGMGGGTALAKGSMYMIFFRCAKRAGVKGKYNPHSMRHAFAKRMLRNGANLAAVSKVMGHSGIAVTHDSYGQYEDAEAFEAHLKYA